MKSHYRTEIIAGLTTFFTMAYTVVVNPAILSTPGTGMTFSGTLTATVMVCVVMTLFDGLHAKLPFGVAPGMGINAFFAYTVILAKGVPWQTGLGIIFPVRALFMVASITPIRVMIALAMPKELRVAVTVGIGLFLTFIGLKNAGIIVANPSTVVAFGTLDGRAFLFILGSFVMVFLISE